MKQTQIFFFGFFTLFIYLSYFLQTTLLLSPDVSYLMHASQQLLQGAHYGKEIFETNPPLILYLYTPIHFFNKIIGDPVLMLRVYVLALATISSIISYILLKKLITDTFYRQCIFFTFLFVLFILPVYAFGQREHLLMILIFPYLLNVALTLENKPLPARFQFCIGIMAGLGFALKPFFLVPLVLIEGMSYQRRLASRKTSLDASLRWHDMIHPNTLAIFLVFICYLASIFIWQPEYLQIILPLTLKYYFGHQSISLAELFFEGRAIFCVFCFAMLISYFVFAKHDRYPIVGRLFCLALVGMLIAYTLPGQPWYYHLYPALGLAFLLLAHVAGQFFWLVVFAIFPLTQCYYLLITMQEYKNTRPQNDIAQYILQSEGARSIYCFAPFTSDCFPLTYQIKGEYAAGVPSLWWFKGIRNIEKNNKTSQHFLQDKQFFIEQVANDLNNYQAHWMIVNEDNFQYWEGKSFNILHYLAENKKFATAMQSYSFVKKIKGYAIYERHSTPN